MRRLVLIGSTWLVFGCAEPAPQTTGGPTQPPEVTDPPDTKGEPSDSGTPGWGEPCGPHWPVGMQTHNCVPDFTLPDADGNPVTISDLRGDHVVVVDLVAMWCGPCWDTADDLELLYQVYEDQGLAVITLLAESGVGVNPTVQDAATWRDTAMITSTVVADVNGTVKHEWSRSGTFDNIPMSYVVSPEGTLEYFASDGELGMARLEEIIQQYLPGS